MENNIRIQNPCNENWSSMLPDKNGRFCTSCKKSVIDFTKMTSSEIQKYYIENSNNLSICGIYKFNQVENQTNTKYTNLRHRFDRIKLKPIKIIALLLLSFLFSFTSCIMGKRSESELDETTEKDSIIQPKINENTQNIDTKKDSIKAKNDSIKAQLK